MGKLGLTRLYGCITPEAEERTTLIISGGSQLLARVFQHDVPGSAWQTPGNMFQ